MDSKCLESFLIPVIESGDKTLNSMNEAQYNNFFVKLKSKAFNILKELCDKYNSDSDFVSNKNNGYKLKIIHNSFRTSQVFASANADYNYYPFATLQYNYTKDAFPKEALVTLNKEFKEYTDADNMKIEYNNYVFYIYFKKYSNSNNIATEGFFFRNKNSSTNIKKLIKSETKNNSAAKNYGANMLNILNDYSKNIALVIEPVNLGKIISLYNKLELISKEFDNATHALYSSINKENYTKCDKIIIKCNEEYKKFKSEYSKLNITETHECELMQSHIYKLNQMRNTISDVESKIDYRRDNLSDPSGKYDDEFDTYLDILQDCEACCSDMETVLGIKGLLEKCKFSFK